ncbi:hypothetical protein GPK27_06545 [Catenibacterium mitsuokai]|uniref:hypothetical protein n=2 Tax=Coprobacillaceae TaxID=2810280 RepID=UPI001C038CB8|nr:hypothetical protein [Catenibacterium mitsuokai]MBT9815105.1 hypothetical protein [Catenibacterium mitsuokai]
MMNLEKYNDIYDKVAGQLFDENIDYDDIDFIISKNHGHQEKWIVGFTYGGNHFVYTSDNEELVNYQDIQLKRKYGKVLEPNINSFILTKLNDGYEVDYVKADIHCWLWNFIAEYLDDTAIIEKGIEKYLWFCKETGINATALTFYWGREIRDIYSVFIDSRFDGFDIILSEYIGEKRLILGIQHQVFFNNNSKPSESIIYRVTVYHKETHKIEFNDFHEDIQQAFADYRNHFFGLSYSYYLQKEQDDKQLIAELNKLVLHPLW